MWPRRPTAAHCAGVGEALAKMHLAGRDFPLFAEKSRSRSPAGGRCSICAAPRADSVQAGLSRFHRARADASGSELAGGSAGRRHPCRSVSRQRVLPRRQAVGLIDFYFACNDILAYDVAICLNAWCFEPDHSFNVTKARALLNAYGRERNLSDAERGRTAAAGARRRAALPADAAGRFAQRAAGRAGQAEGPAGICPQAALPSGRQDLDATTA